MFIKKIEIKNFRIFPSDKNFEIDNINIPNRNLGSGLTVLVGENGCGKTTILEALALPILEYKAESFLLEDFNDTKSDVEVKVYTSPIFKVKKTFNGEFESSGFYFNAHLREKNSKSYLSSTIVTEQKLIKKDSEAEDKLDYVNLMLSIKKTASGGKRFEEPSILLLDKNRLFQTRSGSFNKTKFDRLMDDLNFQYLSSFADQDLQDLNSDLNDKVKSNRIKHELLSEAIKKFSEISESQVKLEFLSNYEPFKNAFFLKKTINNQQIPISNLGSGYEMIFSIIYSFYLSKQSGKQLIILVDEPELHMHPNLQEKFVELLLEFSKDAQIIITSHSPLLVKQLSSNDLVKVLIVKKEGVSPIENRVLPFLSANETNYLAFGLPTEEYHNELYNEIEHNFWNDSNNDFKALRQSGSYDKNDCRQIVFDNEFFSQQKKELIDSPFKNIQNKVTLHTYIRNQIHHQRDNGKPEPQKLKSSIERMRSFL